MQPGTRQRSLATSVDFSVGPQGASHFVIGDVVQNPVELEADVLVARVDDEAPPTFYLKFGSSNQLLSSTGVLEGHRPYMVHLVCPQSDNFGEQFQSNQRVAEVLDFVRPPFHVGVQKNSVQGRWSRRQMGQNDLIFLA